jgi:tRNA (guanine-N7-)-methyltransferase
MVNRPEFHWRATTARDWRDPPEDWVETRYQRKTAAAGRRPVFLCFERRPRRQDRESPCD